MSQNGNGDRPGIRTSHVAFGLAVALVAAAIAGLQVGGALDWPWWAPVAVAFAMPSAFVGVLFVVWANAAAVRWLFDRGGR